MWAWSLFLSFCLVQLFDNLSRELQGELHTPSFTFVDLVQLSSILLEPHFYSFVAEVFIDNGSKMMTNQLEERQSDPVLETF